MTPDSSKTDNVVNQTTEETVTLSLSLPTCLLFIRLSFILTFPQAHLTHSTLPLFFSFVPLLLLLLSLFLLLSELFPPSPTFFQGQPFALLLAQIPIVPLLLFFSPSFSFISIILCGPLHLLPSTPLFSAFICSWPGVGRPHIQWPVGLLIFLKAPLLVLYLLSPLFYTFSSPTLVVFLKFSRGAITTCSQITKRRYNFSTVLQERYFSKKPGDCDLCGLISWPKGIAIQKCVLQCCYFICNLTV